MIKVDDNVVNTIYFMLFVAVGEDIGKRKNALLHHYHDGYGNNKSLGLMTFVNRSEKTLLSYNYGYSVTLMLVTDVGGENFITKICW